MKKESNKNEREIYVNRYNKKNLMGKILYRIQALRSFGKIDKGDLGGWVEKEENLSHDGNCWVFENAMEYIRRGDFKGVEVLNWISISDKLPKEGELVLTKSELSDVDTDIDLCRYMCGRFRLYIPNQPNDYGAISTREDLTDCVKFWKKAN